MNRLCITIVLLVMTITPIDSRAFGSATPGSVNSSLLLGAGSGRGSSRGLAWQSGPALSVGVGQDLALGMSATYTGFLESMPNNASYFIDLPLSLTGYVSPTEGLALAISGGVGMGFSDLPAWTMSNRALTGHLAIAASFHNSGFSGLWLELRMVKAATSTANVTFGFLALRYSIKL